MSIVDTNEIDLLYAIANKCWQLYQLRIDKRIREPAEEESIIIDIFNLLHNLDPDKFIKISAHK